MVRIFAVSLGILLATACRTPDASTVLSNELESDQVTLHCSVAKGGDNRQSVTPQIVSGAQVVDEQLTTYAGHKVSVTFNQGDQFEPQKLLTMRFDDRVSQTYDPTQSLYKLGADDGVEFQCYIEYGVMAPLTQQSAPTCSVDKNGANRQNLPVTTVAGAQIVAPTVTTYNGHKLTARFNEGDQFETQQMLWVTMGDDYHQIYDPGRSLFKFVHDDGTQVQCYFPGNDESNAGGGNNELSCSVDKNGADRTAVTVQNLTGSQVADWQFTNFRGHKLAVRFNGGDQFETQQLLWVRLDDRNLKVYDPTKSLYKLAAADGVTIQCYNGNGAPAAKQDGTELGCSVAKSGNNPKPVSPALLAGAEIADPTYVQHSGHKVAVSFNQGDQFESQQLLWQIMDGFSTQVYDPGRSLTVFEANDGTMLQCYFGSD